MKDKEGGFTLVEIAVSVAILAIALVTLIGLQSSHIGNFIVERNRTQAALHGKYILSMLDVKKDPPEPGSSQRSLVDLLQELNADLDAETIEDLRGWEYQQEVSIIPISLNEDGLREVRATISWGDRHTEEFTLVYYMKSKP